MKTAKLWSIAVVLLTASGLWGQAFQYPDTKTVDQVDDFFGTPVADPYRWLEDDVRTNPDVADWVTAQNEVTFGYLKSLPCRDDIERRLTELWDYERYSPPFKEGGRYYYTKNDGLQNQSVLYRQDRLDAEAVVLIDPNTWSADGTIALSGTAFSDDGRYLAFGRSEAGSDWITWRVMEIESGKELDDELKWIKFGGVAWSHDSKGFYYGRYEPPQEGAEFQSTNLNMRIFYHVVGTPQSDDVLVYENPDNPEWGFIPTVTEDGRYLVITVWKGTDNKYRVKYVDLQAEGEPEVVDLIDHFDHEFSFIGNEGSVLFFQSDVDAPNRKVLAIDLTNPAPEAWKTIVPEAEETLSGVSLVNNLLICTYLKDAHTQIKMFGLDGNLVRELALPGIGTAAGFGGKKVDTETFYSFSSFATPPSIFRCDLTTGESTLLRRSEVDFNPDDFEVSQVFFESKDGTRVPMFLAHRKGLERNGRNPTLLWGYGGFNIPVTPSFSVSRLQWMEMGGVLAVANLRGGGEYGERWHQGGTKQNKQNVFDDFIAAGEWLIANKYASPETLGIQGGSNGGLLVGAAMTQRPDLFGACLPAVGVMDMLRFQQFTAGRFWVDDYGDATKSAAEFKALHAYSPYHNLRDGVSYPPTLITTADTDDRVVPGHSFKFAARLQKVHGGTSPVLIRIETRAGHGAGKPTTKQIEEVADQWAFLAKHLGLEPQFPSAADRR